MLDPILLAGYCPLCDDLIDASTRAAVRAHIRPHWQWLLWVAVWWERRERRARLELQVPVAAGACND